MRTTDTFAPNPYQDTGAGYDGVHAWWWADTRDWTDDPQ